MEGFLEGLWFFLVKLAALVTSQRTIVAVVGIVILVGTMWGIAAPLFGMEAGEIPSEDDITQSVAYWLTLAGTIIAGFASIAGVVVKLMGGIQNDPPPYAGSTTDVNTTTLATELQ